MEEEGSPCGNNANVPRQGWVNTAPKTFGKSEKKEEKKQLSRREFKNTLLGDRPDRLSSKVAGIRFKGHMVGTERKPL